VKQNEALQLQGHVRPRCNNPDDPFVAACWDAGVTVSQFCRGIGRSEWSVRSWKNGMKRPDPEIRHAAEEWLRARGIDPALLFGEHVGDVTDITEARRKRGLHTVEEAPMQTASREYLDEAEMEWFGLVADPFDDPPNAEDLCMHPAAVSAERAMFAAVRRRHILALCGDPGAGKSMLLRRFVLRAQRESQVRVLNVASLDRRRVDPSTLAVAILRDLGVKGADGLGSEARSELLRQTLEEQGRAGLFPVLLLDEAHHLRPVALLSVKQLWDSSSFYHQLSVFLVGHRTLSAALRSDPALRELAGRTKVVDLPPLGLEGTTQYLKWRFSRVAGDAGKVFDGQALKEIARRGEYPLWVSNIAVLSMRYAHQVGDKVVKAEHVGRA
jgi:type II secretory pathway predicted ATPase ExeA